MALKRTSSLRQVIGWIKDNDKIEELINGANINIC